MSAINYDLYYDEKPTACVTGRRPQSIRGYWRDPQVKLALGHLLYLQIMKAYRRGYRTFISGMALGVDQDFAEQVLFVRRNIDAEVRLVAAVPCVGQDSRWSADQRRHYRELLKQANRVEMVSPHPYRPELMHLRNEWMIDRSRLVIAAWDQVPEGGTYRAVQYAQRRGRELWEVDTRQVEVSL